MPRNVAGGICVHTVLGAWSRTPRARRVCVWFYLPTAEGRPLLRKRNYVFIKGTFLHSCTHRPLRRLRRRINGKLSLQPDSDSPLCSPMYSSEPKILEPFSLSMLNLTRLVFFAGVTRAGASFFGFFVRRGSGNVPIAVFAAPERKGVGSTLERRRVERVKEREREREAVKV